MAAGLEGGEDGRVEAAFGLDAGAVPQAGAGGFDGVLQAEAVVLVLDEGLHLGLANAVAAGRAECEDGLAVGAGADRGGRADREFGAGGERVGAALVNFAPIEEVVHAHAGVGDDDAAAEQAAEALGDADDIAFAIRHRKRGGVFAFEIGLGGEPLFGEARNGFAVADAGAQRMDVFVGEQPGEFFGVWLVVFDALAGGEADGAPDGVEMFDAVAFHGGEVEAVEDAHGQQELEAFGRWRQGVDVDVAVAHGNGVLPAGADGFEVGHGEAAAEFGEMGDHLFAEGAAIEVAGAVGGDGFEGGGEFGLAEDVAHGHFAAAAGVVLQPVVEEGGFGEVVDGAVDAVGVEFDDGEAVTGERDGGGEDFGQGLAAMGADEFAPAGEVAGRGGGGGMAIGFLAILEDAHGEFGRHAGDVVERADALFGGDIAGGHAEAGEA